MSCVEQNIGKVDCWRNSNQKHRWLAASILDIEPRLNRICGYKYLPDLRMAIREEIDKRYKAKGLLTFSIPAERYELVFL